METTILPLLKAFQAPKASVTINIAKDNYTLGEAITGDLVFSSDEDFEAKEVRVELHGIEQLRSGGEPIRGASETLETRIYSPRTTTVQKGTTVQYVMHNGQNRVNDRFMVQRGFNRQFPFRITIPSNLGPTFQGTRMDGQWLERTWTLKAIVSIGGRPDVEARRALNVYLPSAAPQAPGIVPPVPFQPGSVPVQPTPAPMPAAVQPQSRPAPPREVITSCTRCSAPLSPSQEDLIVTCRYCGYTISVATQDEIKQHSMLENRLLTQQAVEAAQKYMDKGILRSGVSRDAQIINAKLRFIPFWVFPTNTATQMSGVAGQGISGELHQAQEALSDKRSSKLSKFGKLVIAGASAYSEMQQKDKKPRNVVLNFSNYYVWPMLARKTMISEINFYDVPAAKKIPFDVGKIPSDAEFLNTEFNEEEAKSSVKPEIEAKERLIASGKVDTLQSCSTNVTIGMGELVHAPIWFVHYSLRGDNYVILVDGCEGKVLGGGRPLFKFK
jgi:DNA-directed RNA polymerase subunit RPC12/RpoP